MNNISIKKVLASILVISMAFSFLSLPGKVQTVTAVVDEVVSNAKTVNLQIDGNISGITDPSAPADNAAWSGSKVYFGKYGNNPVLFRVLDASTTDYSADGTTKTMLMGSDTLFQARVFNASGSDNTWEKSDIRAWMQGAGDGQFLRQFSATEKDAIFASNKTAPSNTDGALMGGGTFAPLVNDTVFALDVAEVGNTSYGYSYNIGTAVENRIMNLDGAPSVWWTRSQLNNANGNHVSIVYLNGKLTNTDAWKTKPYGVNPAMNLDLSSILYASLVANNEWKLTLLDKSKIVGIQENNTAFKVGQTVTVPYTYSGDGINQISVMITSTERTNAAAQVLYYDKLATVSGTQGSDSATFTLPENLPEGYKVYLIAEEINSGNFTSYASEPVKLDIKVQIELGDLNVDNDVDIADLVAMDEHLNNERQLSLSGYKAADIIADNTIDEKDFNQLVQYLLSK